MRQWVCLQKVLEKKTFVGDPECMATIATINKFNADMVTLSQNLRTLQTLAQKIEAKRTQRFGESQQRVAGLTAQWAQQEAGLGALV